MWISRIKIHHKHVVVDGVDLVVFIVLVRFCSKFFQVCQIFSLECSYFTWIMLIMGSRGAFASMWVSRIRACGLLYFSKFKHARLKSMI